MMTYDYRSAYPIELLKEKRMRIYVASSWRNKFQPFVVETLRKAGHRVYDFKHPKPQNEGFHWSEVPVEDAKNWRDWTPAQFKKALQTDLARDGFSLDMNALEDCEACVLVLPCGKSAHLELGQAVGTGKRTLVYMPEKSEPELMYLMCHGICETLDEVVVELAKGPLRPGEKGHPLHAYAEPLLARVEKHMHDHHEHAGLPPPTQGEIQRAFAAMHPNAFYGKFAAKKPLVWYGAEDAVEQAQKESPSRDKGIDPAQLPESATERRGGMVREIVDDEDFKSR